MSRAPICYPVCANGGTCLQSPDGPVCLCPSGYSGDSCEINVSDTTSYIIIAVVLITGVILTVIIYVIRCCKNETTQQTPRIIQRIISVHATHANSIKIDKENDDAPPEYNDAVQSTQTIEEEDATAAAVESEESHFNFDNSQFVSDSNCSTLNLHGTSSDNNGLSLDLHESSFDTNGLTLDNESSINTTSENEQDGHCTTKQVQTSNNYEINQSTPEGDEPDKSTLEKDEVGNSTTEGVSVDYPRPPSYSVVQKNRASQHHDRESRAQDDAIVEISKNDE